MYSDKCIHLLGLMSSDYEGMDMVENDVPDELLWKRGDEVEEKFDYCPRCGVKLEHKDDGTYTIKDKD
jgi:hypothetical protein